MQIIEGLEIRLKESAVRDAILVALAKNGHQATEATRVTVVSAPGEPIVIAVTELKMGAPPQLHEVVANVKQEPVVKKTIRSAPRLTQSVIPVDDVETALFGGQPVWEGAKPYLPDTDGKIAMPDAGKHVEGQLDDESIVFFDAKRFTVEPVPPGESPSYQRSARREYEVPEELDDVPDQYRAGPPPRDE